MKKRESKVKLGTIVKSPRGLKGQVELVIDLKFRLLILIMNIEKILELVKLKTVKLILNKTALLSIQRLLYHLSMIHKAQN